MTSCRHCTIFNKIMKTSKCFVSFVCLILIPLSTTIWVMDFVKFSLMFFTVEGLPTDEEYRLTDGNTTVVYEIDKHGNLHCSVLIDGTEVSAGRNVSVKRVTKDMMNSLLSRCTSRHRPHQTKRAILFPGTKWCGDGDAAANNSDLGVYRETDECCRDHDLCGIYITGFSHRYGLYNLFPFTRVSCECETEFYSCLKKTNDSASHYVGRLYFNFIRPYCLVPSNKSRCVYSSMWRWLTARCDETRLDLQWSVFNRTF